MNDRPVIRGRVVFAVSLLILSMLSLCGNLGGFSGGNYEFAAEYGNIAAALAEGHGFANPFATDSGPTAWMPPVYPFLMAAIFQVCGVKSTLSLAVLVLIELLGLALIPTLLFKALETRRTRLPAAAIVPLFFAVILTSHIQLFQAIHDSWLTMLGATVLLAGFAALDATQGGVRRPLPLWWGGIAGVMALVSPILGAVAILMLGLLSNRANWPRHLAVVGVALLVMAPWVLRNYLVFDKLIPVKSNLVFDAYQGNYLDDDGILTIETFRRFHPYKHEGMRRQYTALGEKRFMEDYAARFREAFATQAGTFVEKSVNRLGHIVFVHPNAVSLGEAHAPGARQRWFLLARDGLYALPALVVAVLLVSGRFRDQSLLKYAGLICVFALLPFVFVGFYTRYRITVYPLFAIFYFYFANLLLEVARQRGASCDADPAP